MTATIVDFPAGGDQYIRGVFQSSSGITTHDGFGIKLMALLRPTPLAAGFGFLEQFITEQGRPLTPFADAGCMAFNRHCADERERRDMVRDDKNPAAGSNVRPEPDKPPEPRLRAFYLTREAAGASGRFVIAGSGKSKDAATAHFAGPPLARLCCEFDSGSVPARHHMAD